MKRVGGRGYSLDLRERIVNRVKNGENRDDVARDFSVHRQTVNLYCIKDELGTLATVRKSTGRPRLIQDEHEQQLLKQVKDKPDATLGEHAAMLKEATGFKTSNTTVYRVFARHGITLKKRQSLPLSKMKRSA